MAGDWIRVHGIKLECVVAIHPHERQQKQPLIVDLELGLDLGKAGRSGRISDTLDYDRVTDQVITLLGFRRYRLLENAGEELCAMLFGVLPGLENVRVRIKKPHALLGRAAAAEVELQRSPDQFPRGEEQARFGRVEVLLETGEAGLYLLHVAPGGEISAHRHEQMRELEWRVSGKLERDGQRIKGLSPVTWQRGQVHHYRNLGSGWATLFCCDVPAFIPNDEIEVATHGSGGPGA
ncbi:MAG: dihydroneopterin aldolase [Myxococcales bacterium]|nr:dihydroneopterin aldolase [Myxococcales bacterium]